MALVISFVDVVVVVVVVDDVLSTTNQDHSQLLIFSCKINIIFSFIFLIRIDL